MAALAAGIFGGVDPALCLTRAGVALVAGAVLGALLQALATAPAAAPREAAEIVTEARASTDD